MDAFACLGLPRRPLLEEAVLRQAFQEKMKESHPDRVADGAALGEQVRRTEELNRSYALLRDPRRRIRHLLELEGLPTGQVAPLSGPLMQEVMEVSALVQKGRECLARRQAAETMLERAAAEYEMAGLSQRLMDWSGKLATRAGDLDAELAEIDRHWAGGGENARRLAEIDGRKGYVLKWLQETRLVLGNWAEN
jgi:hypothetical protein